MNSRNYDDRTIERWRLEPRISGLEWEDSQTAEQVPPLWKDLTFASVLAVLFWLAAAAILS